MTMVWGKALWLLLQVKAKMTVIGGYLAEFDRYSQLGRYTTNVVDRKRGLYCGVRPCLRVRLSYPASQRPSVETIGS